MNKPLLHVMDWDGVLLYESDLVAEQIAHIVDVVLITSRGVGVVAAALEELARLDSERSK